MTTTYEARALRFAHRLATLFYGCVTLDDFQYAVDYYNTYHILKLRTAHGVSRFAVIRADYVIKFDMMPEGAWSDGQAGNNESEARVYARAEAEGMAHLLAKVTQGEYNGIKFSIMPRVDHVGDESRSWDNYCTDEERKWLWYNVNDLHSSNVGYRNGKVCVIDYAWDAGEDEVWR